MTPMTKGPVIVASMAAILTPACATSSDSNQLKAPENNLARQNPKKESLDSQGRSCRGKISLGTAYANGTEAKRHQSVHSHQ